MRIIVQKPVGPAKTVIRVLVRRTVVFQVEVGEVGSQRPRRSRVRRRGRVTT